MEEVLYGVLRLGVRDWICRESHYGHSFMVGTLPLL